MGYVLFTDGACRGNPGPAAIGASLEQDGIEIASISEAIGTQTNNFSEYTALIEGLKLAQAKGVTDLEVKADSELMIKQLNKIYKVKNANIKPLYEAAIAEARKFASVKFTHVRREFNKRADELANLAY